MTQSVWRVTDIAAIAQTLVTVAPSPEFAAGVAALAQSLGIRIVMINADMAVFKGMPYQAEVVQDTGGL